MNNLNVTYINNNTYRLNNLTGASTIEVLVNVLDLTNDFNFVLKETLTLNPSEQRDYIFDEDNIYQFKYVDTVPSIAVNYIYTTFADDNFKSCLNKITTKLVCEDVDVCDNISNFVSISLTSDILYNIVPQSYKDKVFYNTTETDIVYDLKNTDKLIARLKQYCERLTIKGNCGC